MRALRALAAITLLSLSAAVGQDQPAPQPVQSDPAPEQTEPIELVPDQPQEPTPPAPLEQDPVTPTLPNPQDPPATPAPAPAAPAPAAPTAPAAVPKAPAGKTAPGKSAPAKAIPKKPAAKPAPKVEAKIKRFSLIISAAEQRISGGKLVTIINKKRVPLDIDLIERSRKYRKLSTMLEPTLDAVFGSLVREPRDARFVRQDGEWVAEQRSSWRVDEAATREAMLKAILAGKAESQVVMTVTPPERNVADLAKQGIVTHYAGGTSSYRGSPTFRVTNILAGARRIDGQVIPKGGTFDFNKTVGPMLAANGFVPGYVISGGTLATELGGGICQVSTTIFRAAYNAGLPITERHNHSYRVHYYDPVGLEATVYAPYKNFKFKNDSKAALFVQMSYDAGRQTLSFDLFGPKPDRAVTVSDPVILSTTPAPGPRFVADAAVPLGRTWQMDGAEAGRKVLITRTVKLNGGEVRRDELRSHYVPWGAIYRVNPADPRVLAPEQATGAARKRSGG